VLLQWGKLHCLVAISVHLTVAVFEWHAWLGDLLGLCSGVAWPWMSFTQSLFQRLGSRSMYCRDGIKPW
jgi:hypothetical protein